MSLPLARRNGSAGIMDNNAELNLALPTGWNIGALANNAVVITPDLTLDAARTIFVMCTLVSGQLKIDIDEFAVGAAHNFSAPTKTITVSTTVPFYLALDATAANGLGVGLRLTAGGSGCQIGELLVVDMNEMKQGEGWSELTAGQNASAGALIANTLGTTVGGTTNTNQDGSGIVGRGPGASHTFGG